VHSRFDGLCGVRGAVYGVWCGVWCGVRAVVVCGGVWCAVWYMGCGGCAGVWCVVWCGVWCGVQQLSRPLTIALTDACDKGPRAHAPANLVSVMRGLVKCGIGATSELSAALNRLVLLALNDFTTTQLALYIWSASKLRLQVGEPVQAALLQKIVHLAPAMNAIDVSNILVGLAWFASAAAPRAHSRSRSRSRPAHAPPSEAKRGRKQGRQGHLWDSKSPLFAGAVAALEQRLANGAAGGLNAQGTANVTWALARIQEQAAASQRLPAEMRQESESGANLPGAGALLALLQRGRWTVPEMTPPGLVMMLGAVPLLVSGVLSRRWGAGAAAASRARDAQAALLVELEEQVRRGVSVGRDAEDARRGMRAL
jgi:hypothetical protein